MNHSHHFAPSPVYQLVAPVSTSSNRSLLIPAEMISRQFCLITFFLVRCTNGILLGECIGPRQALERHLNRTDKIVMYNIVYGQFDGKNSQEVMRHILTFVRSRLSDDQWDNILPEIRAHETRQLACSSYAQLLPKELYRRLLLQTWAAAERGAPLATIRTIVNEIVADGARRGLLTPDTAASLTVPEGATYDRYVQQLIPKLPDPQPIPPISQLPWYTAPNIMMDRTSKWTKDEEPRNIGSFGSSKMVPLPAAQPLRG